MNSNKQKITFLLPGTGHTPIGGFKVVYEYANRLSRLGHKISIVHAAMADLHGSFLKRGYCAGRYARHLLRGGAGPVDWFHLDSSIKVSWAPSLAERYIPGGDAVIASSWYTAEWVNHYSAQKGKPFYLIQSLETWGGHSERVYATWRMPFKKIVISHWLKNVADKLGEASVYIPNGLDFQRFGIDNVPQNRKNIRCMMLYHTLDLKGSTDGLRAFSIVQEHIPALEVTLFGVSKAPSNLPTWCCYYRCPSQDSLRTLYNEAAIFVAPSWLEGWGLCATEAMMCGSAVVATDIGGHQEFSFHERTALLSPPKDPEALAANVMRLINDAELRMALAHQGNAFIQRFTWEKAAKHFESVVAPAEEQERNS